VQSLVDLSLTSERKPLTTMQAQRDTLQVRKAIYSDISSKISALQSSITALQGLNNVFGQKAISVKNSSTTTVASVTTNGSSAVAGEYNLTVNYLAQSHQVGSKQVPQTDVGLDLSGTFIIGGAASRSAIGNGGTGNPISQPSDFGVAEKRTGEVELGSGEYSIEFRQDSGVWQFRLVDVEGKAVRIDDASDTGTAMTSNWQNYSLVKNKTYNTERGLTITFSDSDPSQQRLFGDADIAKLTYTAKGASISVTSTSTLNDIRSEINKATFADGNQVQATIVDRRLVLTGGRTGADTTIKMSDVSGNVLQSLDILANAAGTLKTGAQLRAARNADITLNSIQITNRTRNTGLTDLVQGLSIDLLAEGSSATITVSDDSSKIEAEVKKFVDAVNNLRGYLKEKTEAKAGSKDTKGNPTYTPAALGQDWSIRSLRQEIANDLLKIDTRAAAGDPKYLSEIGITVADDGSFKLDTSKLNSMLKSNFNGVSNLFDHLLQGDGTSSDTSLYAHLNRYVSGASAVLSTTQTGLDNQLKNLNSQISSYEKRLTIREATLVEQYSAIQEQLISMTYEYQSTQAFISGSLYNQQY
jgi:flagellar hook-associated protein 2